jgi:hypothetical protein
MGGMGNIAHPTEKAGVFPIFRLLYQAVFHGIAVAIVHRRDKFGLIADGMFPKPSLPKPAFALGAFAGVWPEVLFYRM